MKKIITTFFSLTLALAPATMQAQEHIEAAFKNFIKEVKVSKFETKARLSTQTKAMPTTSSAEPETTTTVWQVSRSWER